MKRMQITLLTVAAVSAIGSAFASHRFLSEAARQTAHPPQAQQTPILTVNKTVLYGGRLSGEDLEWRMWPKAGLSQAIITKQNAPDAITRLEGSQARTTLLAGAPLSMDMVVLKNGGSVLAAAVRPGYRAAAITVREEAFSEGSLAPGDKVDILLTDKKSTRRKRQSITILRGLRVLATSPQFEAKRPVRRAGVNTIRLEVRPDEAEVLATAKVSGELSLTLAGRDGGPGETGDGRPHSPSGGPSGSPSVLAVRQSISLIKFGILTTPAQD